MDKNENDSSISDEDEDNCQKARAFLLSDTLYVSQKANIDPTSCPI